MELKLINEKVFEQMKRSFEELVIEIKELCHENNLGENWLDSQEVCQILNLSKRTLQYYRDSGKLPFSMIGNKCYYKVNDVEKLISDSSIK